MGNLIKLTIELVPATSFYKNVRSAKTASEWDKLRKQVYAEAKGKCSICGQEGRLECHEVWKFYPKTKLQKLMGLHALCNACHEVKHFGLAEMNNHGKRARNHLAKINGWSKDTADKYIAKSFKIWSERSLDTWEVDIKNVNKYLIPDKYNLGV